MASLIPGQPEMGDISEMKMEMNPTLQAQPIVVPVEPPVLVKTSLEASRSVPLVRFDGSAAGETCTNYVKTSRYDWWNFLVLVTSAFCRNLTLDNVMHYKSTLESTN